MNGMNEQKSIELASQFQRELGRIDKPEGVRRLGQDIIDQLLNGRSKPKLGSEGKFDWLRPHCASGFRCVRTCFRGCG